MNIQAKYTPVLDPDFIAPVLWTKAYEEKVAATPGSHVVELALTRLDGTCFRWSGKVLPNEGENVKLNHFYIERIVKFLLWMKGGCTILVAGDDSIAEMLAATYGKGGAREFDWDFIGTQIYDQPITVKAVPAAELPAEKSTSVALGRNLDGYRIGFDLGGSDRKAAAVVNGEVVFSEEVVWDPYHQKDPNYQLEGVDDSLIRAAKHLPQVDAIGGSAAGVYVNSEPRVGSLFRGISKEDFQRVIRRMFYTLKDRWSERMGKDVPFEVVNDGEVTALAGAMGMNDDAVLGIAMGTSLAAGYVDPEGHIMPWLNELAFVPVDYQADGGVDEWSKDKGVGAMYFSQQAVARLAPRAGYDFGDMPYPEQLKKVQAAMAEGDERARKIYETIGVEFGYTIAYFATYYNIRNLLFLGRVATGQGGQLIIDKANEVLAGEFPELHINLCVPDEKTKRHGQAVAAASLPKLG
ncbi:MAG: ROK family protein [Akkermansia sp.]|nr:ROK family protein [Akkermansia sp.]